MGTENQKEQKCLRHPEHEVYFDKKENDWFCKSCEERNNKEYQNPEYSKHISRLKPMNQLFLKQQLVYNLESKPIDKRKKVNSKDLTDFFYEHHSKPLRVGILKEYFKGRLKINDTDTSTTVVSSAIMRRLGRLTGDKWHQERLKGKADGELLVQFTAGPEKYKSSKELKQERLDLEIAENQIIEKLNDLESEKSGVESGYIDDGEDGTYYLDEDEKSESLEYYKAEIKRLEKLLGAKGDEDVPSKESD